MSSTEIAKQERPQQGQPLATLTNDQLKFISNTDFVPKGMRGNLPAILACVATGRAMGLADMDALRSIHIIDGKATMSAELMVKLARRNGHSISGDYGDGEVTVKGKRADTGDEMTVTWTIAMAQRAGLGGKDNWKKYPESMLWARAASQLCRMLFPDVLGGVSYTPDEAQMSDEDRIADSLSGLRAPADTGPDDRPPAEPKQEDAAEVVAEHDDEPADPVTAEQQKEKLELLVQLIDADADANWDNLAREYAAEAFGGRPLDELTGQEFEQVLAYLRSQLPPKSTRTRSS